MFIVLPQQLRQASDDSDVDAAWNSWSREAEASLIRASCPQSLWEVKVVIVHWAIRWAM